MVVRIQEVCVGEGFKSLTSITGIFVIPWEKIFMCIGILPACV